MYTALCVHILISDGEFKLTFGTFAMFSRATVSVVGHWKNTWRWMVLRLISLPSLRFWYLFSLYMYYGKISL